jgi:hypothetical protein
MDRIERRLDIIEARRHGDFRWRVGTMLGTTGAMLGMMARGFHWL